MHRKNLLLAIIASLLLLAVGFLAGRSLFRPKIGFVRSMEIVYGYKGMEEAHELYTQKKGQWESNIDSLKMDLQRAVDQYNNEQNKLSAKQRSEREQQLNLQQHNLEQYVENINQKAGEQEKTMTQGVLNQINAFVEEYGKKHGYDLILATTSGGNILYGVEKIDLTEEILSELNQAYLQ